MKFEAKFNHIKGTKKPYTEIVYEDTVNDAVRAAERLAKKGFRLYCVTQCFDEF